MTQNPQLRVTRSAHASYPSYWESELAGHTRSLSADLRPGQGSLGPGFCLPPFPTHLAGQRLTLQLSVPLLHHGFCLAIACVLPSRLPTQCVLWTPPTQLSSSRALPAAPRTLLSPPANAIAHIPSLINSLTLLSALSTPFSFSSPGVFLPG